MKVMGKIVGVMLIGLAAAGVGGGCTGAGWPPEVNVNISAADASAEIARDPDVFIIDCRSKDEYDRGHLAGAVLIPSHVFESNIERDTIYPEINRGRSPRKDQPIIVYCAIGNRSDQAARWMVNMGYAKARHIDGGMVAWVKDQLPVTTK
jgi:rhodanese-related sulfurtransferase